MSVRELRDSEKTYKEGQGDKARGGGVCKGPFLSLEGLRDRQEGGGSECSVVYGELKNSETDA